MIKRIYRIIIGVLAVIIMIISVSILVISSNPLEITQNEFEELVRNKETASIYFFQDSCGTCQSLRPIVEENSNTQNIKLKYLNADSVNNDFWEKWNISTVPSIIRIESGNVFVYENFSTKDEINDILNDRQRKINIDRQTAIADITYENFFDMMNSNSDFIIYIGRNDCRDCKAFHPILTSYVSETGKGLYYFDVKELRDSRNDGNNLYDDMVDMINLQWVPSILHISDRKVLSKYEYLCKEYYELDEEDKKIMEQQYYGLFVEWMESNY